MLTIKEAKQIGINACIEKLGRDFVTEHKEQGTSAFGECDTGIFCFVGIGNGMRYPTDDGRLVLDGVSALPYRASCTVSLEDGSITFGECVLPTKA